MNDKPENAPHPALSQYAIDELDQCRQQVKEQAREIERLTHNMATLHRAHCELAALKAQQQGEKP